VGKINKGEIVSTRNIASIRTITENFKALDFFNDAKVTSQLDSVLKLIEIDENFKDDKEAAERLGLALDNVINVARTISDIDSLSGEYFRQLDV
jgi:hypothetical protein